MVQEAIDFIKVHPLVTSSSPADSNLSWFGWVYESVGYIYGSNPDGNWLSFTLWIEDNSTGNEVNITQIFDVVEVWSSYSIGIPTNSLISVATQLLETEQGKRFLSIVNSFKIYYSIHIQFPNEAYENYTKNNIGIYYRDDVEGVSGAPVDASKSSENSIPS